MAKGKDRIEIVRHGLAQFDVRDIPAWLACFDPHVTVLEDPSIPDSGRYDGPAGLIRWMEVMDRNWSRFRVSGEHFVERGDDVAVLHVVSGVGKASGVEIEGQFGSVFTVPGDRVTSWTIYAGWEAAIAAVGASWGELVTVPTTPLEPAVHGRPRRFQRAALDHSARGAARGLAQTRAA